MANLYKGYAQQKGFGANLVNIPDPSKRIREQGLTQLAHMRDQLEWNNKQANRFVSALEDNARIEEKNQADNFELDTFYGEKLADQKWRNFETLVKNEENSRKAAKNQIKDLLSLTQSGTALWKAYDENQKKSADRYAHTLYDEHGIGQKKLLALKDLSAEIWEDSSQREAALIEMGLDGVPEDVLQKLRSVSGYRAVAVAKTSARRWALGRELYYSENWNTKVQIPGVGEVDLASATGSQVDTVLQLLDQRARDELGDAAPSSKMLQLSGSYEIMENARVGIRKQKRKGNLKDAINQQHDDEKLIIGDLMATNDDGKMNPGKGVMQAIYYYAGGEHASPEKLAFARKRVVDALVNGLENGDWTWDQVRQLENFEFDHRSGRTTFGNIFKKEWLMIENAGLLAGKREQGLANLDLVAHENKGKQFYGDVLNVVQTGNPSAEDLAKLKTIADQNNWSKASTYLGNLLARGAESAVDEQGIAWVEDKINNSEFVTPEELDELGFSSQGRSAANKLLENHNIFHPKNGGNAEGLEKKIDGLLEKVIPQEGRNPIDSTRYDAKRTAVKLANGQYIAYRAKGQSHAEAYDNTKTYIQDQILNTNADFERYYNKTTGTWEFKGFSASNTVVAINLDEGIPELKENRSLIYNRAYINEEELSRKSAALHKGQNRDLLPRAVYISSNLNGGIKALEAEMAQIEYYNIQAKAEGRPLIQQYPKWYVKKVESAYKLINNPAVERLLDTYEYCNVNKAACGSAKMPIYQKPVQEKARNLSNPDNSVKAYTAVDDGFSDKKLGVNITNASVAQIVGMIQNGHVTVAGRYKFTEEALLEAVELVPGVSVHDKFTPDIQDKLYDAYFKKNGTAIASPELEDKDRLLLESSQRVENDEKLGELSMHEPALLNPKAYDILYAGGRYNA